MANHVDRSSETSYLPAVLGRASEVAARLSAEGTDNDSDSDVDGQPVPLVLGWILSPPRLCSASFSTSFSVLFLLWIFSPPHLSHATLLFVSSITRTHLPIAQKHPHKKKTCLSQTNRDPCTDLQLGTSVVFRTKGVTPSYHDAPSSHLHLGGADGATAVRVEHVEHLSGLPPSRPLPPLLVLPLFQQHSTPAGARS